MQSRKVAPRFASRPRFASSSSVLKPLVALFLVALALPITAAQALDCRVGITKWAGPDVVYANQPAVITLRLENIGTTNWSLCAFAGIAHNIQWTATYAPHLNTNYFNVQTNPLSNVNVPPGGAILTNVNVTGAWGSGWYPLILGVKQEIRLPWGPPITLFVNNAWGQWIYVIPNPANQAQVAGFGMAGNSIGALFKNTGTSTWDFANGYGGKVWYSTGGAPFMADARFWPNSPGNFRVRPGEYALVDFQFTGFTPGVAHIYLHQNQVFFPTEACGSPQGLGCPQVR